MFDFHPLVRDWFLAKFGSPTEPQEQGWPAIGAGCAVLGVIATARTR